MAVERAKLTGRNFEFGEHRFRSAVGEVLRLQGVAADKIANKKLAVSALNESVDIMEETTPHEARNQLVASYLKRGQCQTTTPEQALADLKTAERLVDPAEETGVYRVFIGKARAQIYQSLNERALAVEHAEAVLPVPSRICGANPSTATLPTSSLITSPNSITPSTTCSKTTVMIHAVSARSSRPPT